MSENTPVVLVVEDEPELAELYVAWLESDYLVRSSLGGRDALDELDDDVDVVLLDRRMPDLSGDEVLETIRERGIDCRVAMVTAVEPDFDIIDMGFDDYLVKPVAKETLHDTVERLLARNDYDAGVQEYFSLASKKALLESEMGPTALADSDEYAELERRIDDLDRELDRSIDDIDDADDFDALFRELSDGPDFTAQDGDAGR
jgi:DNA-binding response OmpR family regulator